MFKFTHSAARTIARAALFGSVVLYGPFAIAAGGFAGLASTVQPDSAPEILAQAGAGLLLCARAQLTTTRLSQTTTITTTRPSRSTIRHHRRRA